MDAQLYFARHFKASRFTLFHDRVQGSGILDKPLASSSAGVIVRGDYMAHG
jgi:hypothetical protein